MVSIHRNTVSSNSPQMDRKVVSGLLEARLSPKAVESLSTKTVILSDGALIVHAHHVESRGHIRTINRTLRVEIS